ncbi:hypothetical protein D3C76_640030 [compost metagenome]
MADMEGHLLGLGEEVVRVAVEHHLAHHLDGHQLFRNQLGGVEQIEIEAVLVAFRNHLQGQFPFRVVARFDVLPQPAPVEVRVLAGELLRLVPDQRAGARRRAPVELDEYGLPGRTEQAEGMHTEALHAAEADRDSPVGHHPHDHVRRLRRQRDEIPEGVMGRPTGGNFIVGLRLHRMNEIGKLDRILDEEHRHVIADQVEIAFLGVELDRESAHVADRIGGATRALHRGKADEHRSALAGRGEKARLGQRAEILIGFEIAMRSGTPGVYHAFGYALVVEVGDLLAHDEIFEQ